jgi:hypothetical protein
MREQITVETEDEASQKENCPQMAVLAGHRAHLAGWLAATSWNHTELTHDSLY